jgi:excinuclease UvrABC nuclease subunit
MSITWGNTEFSGPYLLTRYTIPQAAGVYAIMERLADGRYRILYFGETSNFEERITSFHHKFQCWKRQAGSIDNVYFGLHGMSYSTQNQRLQLESELIQQYNPSCNY